MAGTSFDYMSWRDGMLDRYKLEEINLTNGSSTDIVTGPTAVTANTTGTLYQIQCPAGQLMTVLGKQHVPSGSDTNAAYYFGMRVADTADTEISDLSEVHIYKRSTSGAQIEIGRWLYGTLKLHKSTGTMKGENELFRFPQTIEIPGQTSLMFDLVNPNLTTSTSDTNTQFIMHADLFTPLVM